MNIKYNKINIVHLHSFSFRCTEKLLNIWTTAYIKLMLNKGNQILPS